MKIECTPQELKELLNNIEKIKISYSSKNEGTIEKLSKIEAKQKILELFESKIIESVDITYKEEPAQCVCTSSKN